MISDGTGVAVLGHPGAVERFLTAHGLYAESRTLALPGAALGAASDVLTLGATVAENSGRWVKMTKESARLLAEHTPMKGSTPGTFRGVIRNDNGITDLLEFFRPGSPFANPAMLAGIGGVMAQLAMQQSMAEITDYLEAIDKKVDDVLRAQKDAVLADMIGVDLMIDEAMAIRDEVGGVSEVTWSKIQDSAGTIARTQAYALRRLDGLVEKLAETTKVGDLARIARDVETEGQEWLAVLAHCCRLADGLAVLELDRVLDALPEELDRHRLALRTARRRRLDLIDQTLDRLAGRMAEAADRANQRVLLHPGSAPAVVESGERVRGELAAFRDGLGLSGEWESLAARRWLDAAGDVRDRALETGAEGLGVARRIGVETLGRTRAVTGGIAERARRRRGPTEDERPVG
nr:hypothetical protein [Cellulomonas denverensis]